MPEKLSAYKSPGEKIISLFAKLLFSRERYSLKDLARLLGCSRQSVLRYVNDIRKAYGVDIEETTEDRQNYYRLKTKSLNMPSLPLTESELLSLQMCQAFTAHVLGAEFFREATRAIEKTQSFVSGGLKPRSDNFASFATGTIDYTPYQSIIRTLIEAMDNRRVCQITYQTLMGEKAKTYLIAPLKIFSYRDSLYLDASVVRKQGENKRRPGFHPLLVIHRFKKVELTEQDYKYPPNYCFDDVFNGNFGIMKDDCFDVEVEFTGWVAHYVAERTWSPNQKIKKLGKNKIRLTFSASSDVELISWILSFGEEAKVIKPKWVIEEIQNKLEKLNKLYSVSIAF